VLRFDDKMHDRDSHAGDSALSVIVNVDLVEPLGGSSNGLEVPRKCKIDVADTRLCTATIVVMVYSVYCFLTKAVLQKCHSGNCCRVGAIPRNCLQAAADLSQPYKGVLAKPSFASMPVSCTLGGLNPQSTTNGPSALPFSCESCRLTLLP
jgi:hypothetical protein